jgi:hypothetical protein
LGSNSQPTALAGRRTNSSTKGLNRRTHPGSPYLP